MCYEKKNQKNDEKKNGQINPNRGKEVRKLQQPVNKVFKPFSIQKEVLINPSLQN